MNNETRFAATAARVTLGDNAVAALTASLAKQPKNGEGHFYAPVKKAVEDKTHPKHLANFALWLLLGRPDDIKAPYATKTVSVADTVVRDAMPQCRLAVNNAGVEGVLVCAKVAQAKTLAELGGQFAKGKAWGSVAVGLRADLLKALKAATGAEWVLTQADRKAPVLLVDTAASRKLVAKAFADAPAAKTATKPATKPAVATKEDDAKTAPAVTVRENGAQAPVAPDKKEVMPNDLANLRAANSATLRKELVNLGHLPLSGFETKPKTKAGLNKWNQVALVLATVTEPGGPLSPKSVTTLNTRSYANAWRKEVIDETLDKARSLYPALFDGTTKSIRGLDAAVLLYRDPASGKEVPLAIFSTKHRNAGLKGGLKGLKTNGKKLSTGGKDFIRLALELTDDDLARLKTDAKGWWNDAVEILLASGYAYGGGALLSKSNTAVLVVYKP